MLSDTTASSGSKHTDCSGTFTTQGYNLIGNNSGCSGFTNGVNGDQVGTSGSPLNPQLGSLANHSGATLTHALLSDSPAIDKGNPAVPGSGGNACPASDQRNYARPVDGDNNGSALCDTGTYEVGAAQAGAAAATTITVTYGYDGLYRLTGATYSTGAYFYYTYDAVGNRLTQTTLTNTTVYTYDVANRLTNVGSQVYTWDNNGNLLKDGVYTYTYDAANRLTSVGNYGFEYRCNGLSSDPWGVIGCESDRVSQTVNGVTTNYVLDQAAGLTQVLADGTNTYLYGLNRIGEQQPGGFVYHLPDVLGSVRQLTNASGSVTLARSYEPYGSVLSSAGSGTTNYSFTGEWRDATNLLYLRARYLSTQTGRFLTRDTWPGNAQMPGTLHHYLYAEGNPVNAIDPSGHYCVWGNNLILSIDLPGNQRRCTPEEAALAAAQQQAIGQSIGYAKQFGARFGEMQVWMFLHASASFWQTDLVQTPIGNRDVILGYEGDIWDRVDASIECAGSTALPIAGYLLLPYTAVKSLDQAFALSDDIYSGYSGSPSRVYTIDDREALRLNLERGRQLAQAGQLPQEYVTFFEVGGSDGAVPSIVPADELRTIISDMPGVKGAYIVGRPALGKDLDLVIFGQGRLQLSSTQLTELSSVASQAGFDGINQFAIQNYTSLSDVAALRFATHLDSLPAALNLRHTMLWRKLYP